MVKKSNHNFISLGLNGKIPVCVECVKYDHLISQMWVKLPPELIHDKITLNTSSMNKYEINF